MSVRDLAARVLCLAGVPAWARRRRRTRLPIVMWHGVVADPLAPACWHQVALRAFERQIAWVAARYRPLPLLEALDRLRDGTLPPRSIAVTFDDGFDNVRTRALPVLVRHRVPATVFVVTDASEEGRLLWPDRLWLAIARTREAALDARALGLGTLSLSDARARGEAYARVVDAMKDLSREARDARLAEATAALRVTPEDDPGEFRLLDWAGAREMLATGLVTFGAHTRTHPILSRLADDDVEREVAGSARRLRERLGVEPTVFAYPNGRPKDFDDRARRAVVAAGYRHALSTSSGSCDAGSDPLALPRYGVGADTDFARFRLLVSGALDSPRAGTRARSGTGA